MKHLHKKSLFIKGMVGLCTLIVGNAYAQVNYVLNPSLEELYQCPDGFGQVHYAKHWFTPINGESPDLLTTCTSFSFFGVPYNFITDQQNHIDGFQYPKTGGNYGHFATYIVYQDTSFGTIKTYTNQREYIKVEMKEKLSANKTYCVKYYLNLHNFSKYGSDEIGAYFSGDGLIPNPQWNTLPGAYLLTPQIKSPTGVALTDTLNWMPVTGTFTAQGNERFIIFGSYKSDAQTYLSMINPNAPTETVSYYLDDVSVIESDLPAYAGEDVTIGIGDSVFIGRQPEIGLECVWTDLQGNVVGNEAGMWVKPTQPTTYIVTQDLCGNIQHDTVTVYAYPTSVQVPLYLQSVQLFPNPAHRMITLSLPQAQELSLQLFSPEGKKVWQGATQSVETDIPLPAESGVYFLEIRDAATGGRIVKKVVRE